MKTEEYHNICITLKEIIKGTAWEGHVYLVGGCVRDELMHMEIHDIDLAVNLPNGGIRFVRWLEKRHLTARGRSVQVFEHFGTAKVRLRAYPREVIDCVQTRRGRYVYEEEPNPLDNFGTIEEDAACRDLTINSLYRNLSTGELLDPTGKGLSDIERHVIQTPNDPDISLRDNAMHVLRCIRFSVRYGWPLSQSLVDGIKRNLDILAEATPTRMLKEMTSIMALENKELALSLIEEAGAMPYVMPTLEYMKTMQKLSADIPHKRHRHRGGRHTRRRNKEQPASPHPVSTSKKRGRHHYSYHKDDNNK